MKNCMWMVPLCAILLGLIGCNEEMMSSSPEWVERTTVDTDKADPKDGKYDLWGYYDDPQIFTENLEFRIAELPLEGEAATIPWAGSYWPVWQDTINYAWAGANSLSPAAKYGEAFGIDDIEFWVSSSGGVEKHSSSLLACSLDSDCDGDLGERCAKRAENEEGVCIPTWWGICHAWAPAAILEPEPLHPVTRNGVTFEVNDLKALITLAYNKTNAKFVSLRCNENDEADEIEYDAYNSPTGTDVACKDTNPGTFHVILTNYLGIQGQSFVEDRTFDYQVWNQPLRGYRVLTTKEVTVQEANELLGVEPDDTEESNTVSFGGSVQPSVWHHEGPFDVAAGTPVTVSMTGTGDADLYVRFGATPTTGTFVCRPYLANSSDETCNLTVPEGETELYVSVYGWHGTTMASTFNATISKPAEKTAIQSETDTGTLAPGAWRHMAPISVAPAQKVRVVMTGTGDADLYVRFNEQPTAIAYSCRSWEANSSEEYCELSAPANATTLHVAINGWHEFNGNSDYNTTVFVETKPSSADGYLFSNPQATQFFYFRTAVEYIYESPSWQDGNLSEDIDSYTGTDIYEYILEVDADGKITGGEWVGSSKQNHPDFLWLPTGRVETEPIAYGKIDYALLKELILESVTPLESIPPTAGETLVVHEAGDIAKGEWLHLGPFDAGHGEFTATMTGTGDADLYVRTGNTPTLTEWDCRPYSGTSNETCSAQGPAEIFVSVRGYRDSTFALKIAYTTAGGGEELPPEPTPAHTITHLDETGTVVLDEMKIFTLEVLTGQTVVVQTTAPNDIDLYLRMALAPTKSVYEERGYTTSGNETLAFIPPAHGILYIGVHGYESSVFTLTTFNE